MPLHIPNGRSKVYLTNFLQVNKWMNYTIKVVELLRSQRELSCMIG
jgi:hypothetical protein